MKKAYLNETLFRPPGKPIATLKAAPGIDKDLMRNKKCSWAGLDMGAQLTAHSFMKA